MGILKTVLATCHVCQLLEAEIAAVEFRFGPTADTGECQLFALLIDRSNSGDD